MGKWTPDYIDDVLHTKIKNLVSGAIKRSALEKNGPHITYEDFVHDLDIGDSFTTSLIDILVKELAERRTRPRMHDRRFIADRSAKSLRQLGSHGIYERSLGRFHRNRRFTNLSEYLSPPPIELDTEEDEESFENMLDNATAIEGVRLNSDLYEAFGTHEGGPASRSNNTPSILVDGAASPPPPPPSSLPQPFSRSGPWSMAHHGSLPSTSLTRQPSIRRPLRSSRAFDFNEFTSRRRSATRDHQLVQGEPDPSNRDHVWAGNSGNTQTTRRFFPFTRNRRSEPENYSWAGSGANSPWSMPSPIPPPVPLPADNTSSSEWSTVPWGSVTTQPPGMEDETWAGALLSDERMQRRLGAGGPVRRQLSDRLASRSPEDGTSNSSAATILIPSILDSRSVLERAMSAQVVTQIEDDVIENRGQNREESVTEPVGRYPTPSSATDNEPSSI